MAKKRKNSVRTGVPPKRTVWQFAILALLVVGGIITVYVSQQPTNTSSKAYDGRYQTAEQAGRTTPGRASTPSAPQTFNAALGIPTGLTATQVTNTRIQLQWQPVVGANLYRVYRNNTYIGQGSAGMGPNGPLPTTTFEDALVTCGMTYDYQVAAVVTTDGQTEAAIANSQSQLSAKTTIHTDACTTAQAGPPVCTGIEGPSQVPMGTLATFTFTYTGNVNAVQWNTTGYTYTADNFYHPSGTLYPPNQLTIKWNYTPKGTYQVNAFVYDNNFVQSKCPPKTVTVN